jgi:hypothetical protein
MHTHLQLPLEPFYCNYGIDYASDFVWPDGANLLGPIQNEATNRAEA